VSPDIHRLVFAFESLLAGRFARWTASVDGYTGSDFDYLNEKGIIPQSAIMKKGERRADAFAEPVENIDEGDDATGKGQLEEMEG
jgi:hypothetical protein